MTVRVVAWQLTMDGAVRPNLVLRTEDWMA